MGGYPLPTITSVGKLLEIVERPVARRMRGGGGMKTVFQRRDPTPVNGFAGVVLAERRQEATTFLRVAENKGRAAIGAE